MRKILDTEKNFRLGLDGEKLLIEHSEHSSVDKAVPFSHLNSSHKTLISHVMKIRNERSLLIVMGK